MILVKIGRMEGKIQEMAMAEGCTIEQVLHAANLRVGWNEAVFINGVQQTGGNYLNKSIRDKSVLLIDDLQEPRKRSYENEPNYIKWALLLWNIAHAPNLPAAERVAEKYKDILGG